MSITFDRFGWRCFKTDEGDYIMQAGMILVDLFRVPVTIVIGKGAVFLPKTAKGDKIQGELGFEAPILEALAADKKAQAVFNREGGKGKLSDAIGKGVQE